MNTVLGFALAGLALGAAIGAIAQVTAFCSVGAVADIVLAKDWRRMRSWLMAAGVALSGTQALSALGWADLTGTPYGLPMGTWPVVLLGSIAFGYGMALAGGCVQRALVRVGSGSVKSAATLFLVAITAAATLVLAPRAVPASVTLPHAMALAISLGLGGALILFAVVDPWFRKSPEHLWGGGAIGAAIALAWVFADGHRGFNLLMDLGVASAIPLGLAEPLPVFGLAALGGIVVGAAISAAVRGDLSRDRFVDGEDVKRHIIGGVLMGLGGALAYGCTFGQGLAGLSTLSMSSVIAIAGMGIGCLWGIRVLEAGTAWGGLKLMFGSR